MAEALDWWLPLLNPSFDTWLSNDISPGERWNEAIQRTLTEARFGILCVTRASLSSPWLMFEAGALARAQGEGRVVPYLVGVAVEDLDGLPLGSFQSKAATIEGTLQLVRGLNAALPEAARASDDRLLVLFESLWPQFARRMAPISVVASDGAGQSDPTSGPGLPSETQERLRSLDRRVGDLTVRVHAFQSDIRSELRHLVTSLSGLGARFEEVARLVCDPSAIRESAEVGAPGSLAVPLDGYCSNCGAHLTNVRKPCEKCGFTQTLTRSAYVWTTSGFAGPPSLRSAGAPPHASQQLTKGEGPGIDTDE